MELDNQINKAQDDQALEGNAGIYKDDKVVTLDPMEHIRLRPGMYIGKLGDGTSKDDGIYVLLKEVIDNSIDEYTMGFGTQIQISIDEEEMRHVVVRDFGRENKG